METYSQTQAMEEASDPVSKWTAGAGETGLEEPLWQLELGGGPESYPVRPDKEDCRYYLRTGFCGYGNLCRFNHPRDRTTIMEAMRASGGDFPERLGQPVCQFYLKTGTCKFGASCKYHHPSQGAGSPMPATLNIYGYPLRQGEKECSYYVKTGQCKFGVTCKFHHPQAADLQVSAPVSGTALVGPAASASTLPNIGASPVYGVTQSPAYTGQVVPVSSVPALSGSGPMSDYSADLPLEVISDILVRLPAKSIGRSRCVSKPWLSILTSYEFIKAHLAHHTHLAQEQKLLLFSESPSPSLFSLTLHPGGNHLRELEFFDEQVINLVGSCNGLVLGRGMWLINCLTEEYVKLPDSPFPLCQHLSFKQYGFGYDEPRDDYKVVKISQCDYGQFEKDQPNCPEIFVDIYSLKMRYWKRLSTPLYGHDLIHHDSCVFLNGAIHWIGLKSIYTPKRSTVIGAFSLSDEKFTEIPAPASVNERANYLWAKLMVIDGCLGIMFTPYGEKTNIWLMKSYSLVDSWTKIVIDFEPLCFYQDKFLFCKGWPRVLKWYWLKDGRVEVCLALGGMPDFENDTYDYDDDERDFSKGITYAESLVSPHFNYQN